MNDRSALFLGYLAAVSAAWVVLGWAQDSLTWVLVHLSVLILVLLGTGLWKNLRWAFRAAAGQDPDPTPEGHRLGTQAVFTANLINLTLGTVGMLGGLVPWMVLPGLDPRPYWVFFGLSAVTTGAGAWILIPVGRALARREPRP